MGLRIGTNTASISAQRALGQTTKSQSSSLQKLASGSRIVKSSDDAAGMAISEKLKSDIRSTQQANRNANDGISMIQVAEGGLNETQNILTRLRELSIQSASDTIGDKERALTDMEYQHLKEEVQRISESVVFNGIGLLNGEGDPLEFQIGLHNVEANDRISYHPGNIDASAESLSIDGISVASQEGAQNALENIDFAIDMVSGQRANLGALQNRLSSTSRNLETSNENLSAANSRIRDVDYATETANNAKNNILSAAGTSVLSQANSQGRNVLQLIG
jgi:flagellin